MKEEEPVVPATVVLPEITVKAVALAIVLAAVLAGANADLGLFAGMTVSASIPAAVTSMAILRLFRRSNILENNIVQTAASSGEALAAGVIFTLPALVIIGYWEDFRYWETVLIATVGGLLGVLFTIPLRRALILTARLRFPEGVATAEVLKMGRPGHRTARSGVVETPGRDFRTLLTGAGLGAAMKLGESGTGLWMETMEWAGHVGRSVLYLGMNLSPALVAVGFIIGLNTASVVFLGGAVAWGVLIPLVAGIEGIPDGTTAIASAKAVWHARIRYVGIGGMLVGGIWTLLKLRQPVWSSLATLKMGYRQSVDRHHVASRTEHDASLPWIVLPFFLSLFPMAWIYVGVVGDVPVGLAMTLMMTVAAFLFSSVAGYMAGVVGSSSNPVSGVTIATIMVASLLLVLFMGRSDAAGPAAALLIGGVVCRAAAMGGDNLQDLKTGHLVGATPWKQQIMQIVGVLTGAVVMAPVLTLLQAKYGIGAPTATFPHPLSAPQATLMASLAQSVFGGSLPWEFVGLGILLGIGVIVLDSRQERRRAAFRFPVLAVALGIYLPFTLSAAIFAGGLLAALVRRHAGGEMDVPRLGMLGAAGLITGEAFMGILLAVPVALSGLWPGFADVSSMVRWSSHSAHGPVRLD